MIPIFIGGCERSGTTMLGSLVGGHEECLTTPAAQFLTDTARGFGESAQSQDLQRIRSLIERHPQFGMWGIPFPRLRGESDLSELYTTLFREFAAKHKPKAKYWVTHSPANIRHGPSLSRLFPRAKFLHVVRDGRGVAASLRKLPGGKATMRHFALLWSERLSHGLALEHAFGRQRVLRVRYEDLLFHTAAELRQISEFLGIDYQENMVTGAGFRTGTKGGHALVGQAPQRSRSEAWLSDLSEREIELFEFYSAELLESLGYEPRYGLAACPPDLLERISATMVERKHSVQSFINRCISVRSFR